MNIKNLKDLSEKVSNAKEKQKDYSFDDNLKKLSNIKDQCGSLTGLKTTDTSLGNFVKDIRKKYRNNSLKDEKKEKLVALGFPFEAKPSWEDHYQQLVEFKQLNDHTLVPCQYPDKPGLGEWVRTQRKEYKKKMEGKIRSLEFDLKLAKGCLAILVEFVPPVSVLFIHHAHGCSIHHGDEGVLL